MPPLTFTSSTPPFSSTRLAHGMTFWENSVSVFDSNPATREPSGYICFVRNSTLKSYIDPYDVSEVPSISLKLPIAWPLLSTCRPEPPAFASHVALTALVASPCGTKKAYIGPPVSLPPSSAIVTLTVSPSLYWLPSVLSVVIEICRAGFTVTSIWYVSLVLPLSGDFT